MFGRNPRVPSDLLQENPNPVSATAPLHDPNAARATQIRSQARIALAEAQDDISLRTALAARPRAERDFLAGDYVAYWRSQKYEKGIRKVGGKWYGTAIIMGKLGRNFLINHRKNLFKVAPEHLRHITTEERMLAQKVLAGKCHSPTLSQFGRSLILQLLVSHQWEMNLGDIKGAFLEANVKEKALSNPVYAELPPGGVPGVPPGSLVQILGNIYGANDAPHEWYQEFDRTAVAVGFTRSKFDACLYFCYGPDGQIQGVLGAHVDDTITGGNGERYVEAIEQLRKRFPFRKWRTGNGEFLGTIYEQCPKTKEITYAQKEYAENLRPIPVANERSKQPWLPATEKEVSALRAVNGALQWLCTQTRPDLAVQTSLSQQCFPNPTVYDLLQVNQAVRRAKQQSDFKIKVPYIPVKELSLCFWSDAAFANTTELKTQGGWDIAFTSNRMSVGDDVPVYCFAWKSYKLPRVVSSTLGGEAQAFATASGVCEWVALMLSEAIDGQFLLEEADEILCRRKPLGISDCRSLYDHLISLTNSGTVEDKRTAIDIAIIRQSIQRTGLEPRWCATGHMVADGLTKDKCEPIDLLRSVVRAAKYQLADEQTVLDRKKAEKEHRKHKAAQRAEANGKNISNYAGESHN